MPKKDRKAGGEKKTECMCVKGRNKKMQARRKKKENVAVVHMIRDQQYAIEESPNASTGMHRHKKEKLFMVRNQELAVELASFFNEEGKMHLFFTFLRCQRSRVAYHADANAALSKR
jgi:hypothetical protein